MKGDFGVVLLEPLTRCRRTAGTLSQLPLHAIELGNYGGVCLVFKVLLSLTRWGDPAKLRMEEELGAVATLLTAVGLGVSIDKGEEDRHHTLLCMVGNPLTENGKSSHTMSCTCARTHPCTYTHTFTVIHTRIHYVRLQCVHTRRLPHAHTCTHAKHPHRRLLSHTIM